MNFKKIISFILLYSSLFTNCFPIFAVETNKQDRKSTNYSTKNYSKESNINTKKEFSIADLPAKSYSLTQDETGQVLYEKNADEKLPIASITKIMTILLVVEAIKENKISLKDKVTITEDAKPSNHESSIWASVGEVVSLVDLLKATVVNSANDAARSLAIHVAGSEKQFVEIMNKRAKELGMKNTNFTNATGLDEENNYSSARDVSIMAKELLKCSWITNYTTIQYEKGGIRDGKINLGNTNKLLTTYKGCNGLKTGTEEKAGKCLCATAVRNKIPLCAVSLGSEKEPDRWKNCTTLLDYGFNNFQAIKLDNSEIEGKKIDVIKGKQNFVGCECEKNKEKTYLVKKTQARNIKTKIECEEKIESPIKKGDIVGEISHIDDKGNVIYKQDIYAAENVERLNFPTIFNRLWKGFLTGSKFYD